MRENSREPGLVTYSFWAGVVSWIGAAIISGLVQSGMAGSADYSRMSTACLCLAIAVFVIAVSGMASAISAVRRYGASTRSVIAAALNAAPIFMYLQQRIGQ